MTNNFETWAIANLIARTDELPPELLEIRLKEICTKDAEYLKAISACLPGWMDDYESLFQESVPEQAGDAELILNALHKHYFPQSQPK